MLICVVTTITKTPSDTGKSSSGVSGGAVAGIVIAVLIFIAIGAGAFIYIRRRRADEYQKQFEGTNSGSNLHQPFGTDQRLEPGMVQKRASVGSLADERDYSRKILRVSAAPPHQLKRMQY